MMRSPETTGRISTPPAPPSAASTPVFSSPAAVGPIDRESLNSRLENCIFIGMKERSRGRNRHQLTENA